jgi:hypothetical protein
MLITDPDQLNQGTEVTITTGSKTIDLNIAGNLSTDGVTLKALYSFLKEEWKNDSALIKFPFPMTPITDESFEFKDGWDLADDASRYLIRTGGWKVLNTSGNVTQIWSGIVGLGTVSSGAQLYYDNGPGATNFQLTNQVNQAIQIVSDPNGDGNYADGFNRRTAFTMYLREQGKVFGRSTISDIGVTSMDSIVYRFPISNSNDLKVTTADVGIDADSNGTPDVSPYSGMSITYHGTAQARTIGGTSYNFGIIINGNSGTAEQIYEFVQFQLRRNADIDAGAGTVTGKTAADLLRFTGDNLSTLAATNPAGGGTGVYIDNFLVADTNRLSFIDNTGTSRTFPFVAALTLQFNSNLVSDGAAIYRVFYTTNPAGNFGTSNAVLVDNNSGSDMAGSISGSSVSLDFDYDGNVQGGRTAGTDASITVVAIGLTTGQYVSATGTIARSTSNVVSLVAPLERNYSNP